MRCPHCDADGKAVRVCATCGEAFATQDLERLDQLTYLLAETAEWEIPAAVRQPYQDELQALQQRVRRRPAAEPAPAPVVTAPIEAVVAVSAEPDPTPVPPTTATPSPSTTPQRADSEPFDQWLLSERNIKIALYAGGAMLVIAGLIFIGVNWTRIPGLGKFAITVLVTASMYWGGTRLFKRPAYRIGGVALIAIASSFLTLNFAVLQIYVLAQRGIADNVTWLVASLLCLAAYVVTARWTRHELLTLFGVAAVASAVTALLALLDSDVGWVVLAYAVATCGLLAVAWTARRQDNARYVYRPTLILAQLFMPLVLLLAFVVIAFESDDLSRWVTYGAVLVAVLFYLSTDRFFSQLWARWPGVGLFMALFVVVSAEMGFDDMTVGIALMVLALIYLGIGQQLQRRTDRLSAGLPLYIFAALGAGYVTALSLFDQPSLIRALVGDVVLLTAAYASFRQPIFAYAAAWLLMLPVYLVAETNFDAYPQQGIIMGLLGLVYVGLGGWLWRRASQLAWVPLSAAVFLTALVPVMTWSEVSVAAVALGVILLLYSAAALWSGRSEILAFAWIALNVFIVALHRIAFADFSTMQTSLMLSGAVVGALLACGGLWLWRIERLNWAIPLLLGGWVNVALAYAGALVLNPWLAVAFSFAIAALLLIFAWVLFNPQLEPYVFAPWLSKLSAVLFFVGHLFLFSQLDMTRFQQYWTVSGAAVCVVFILSSWWLRGERTRPVFGTPFNLAGMALTSAPALGALVLYDALPTMLTYGILTLGLLTDGLLRRRLLEMYAAVATFIATLWAIFDLAQLAELQIYVIPAGAALLGLGWYEKRQERMLPYRGLTLLGLLLLMGTVFVQSIVDGALWYAILLAAESMLAILWGIRSRSRGFVQVGGAALLANVVVQLGPSFVDLPRWIQLGLTGTVLLAAGLVALFRREQLLVARRRLTTQWKQWDP